MSCHHNHWFGRERTDVTHRVHPVVPPHSFDPCVQRCPEVGHGRSFTDVTILQEKPIPDIPCQGNEASHGRINTDVSRLFNNNPKKLLGTVNDPRHRNTGCDYSHGRKQTDLTNFRVFSCEDRDLLEYPTSTRVRHPADLVDILRTCPFSRCPVGNRRLRRLRDDTREWSSGPTSDRYSLPRAPPPPICGSDYGMESARNPCPCSPPTRVGLLSQDCEQTPGET